jgi:hypothetical protein
MKNTNISACVTTIKTLLKCNVIPVELIKYYTINSYGEWDV